MVRHHAEQDFDTGVSFIPTLDMSTHTFGASVELRPDQLDLAKVAHLMNRMSSRLLKN